MDIQFERGKSYAIIGPSGSGKSTILNLMFGGFSDYEGKILLMELSLERSKEIPCMM